MSFTKGYLGNLFPQVLFSYLTILHFFSIMDTKPLFVIKEEAFLHGLSTTDKRNSDTVSIYIICIMGPPLSCSSIKYFGTIDVYLTNPQQRKCVFIMYR